MNEQELEVLNAEGDDFLWLDVPEGRSFDVHNHLPVLAGVTNDQGINYIGGVFDELGTLHLCTVRDKENSVTFVDISGSPRRAARFVVLVLKRDPQPGLKLSPSAVDATGNVYWQPYRPKVLDAEEWKKVALNLKA